MNPFVLETLTTCISIIKFYVSLYGKKIYVCVPLFMRITCLTSLTCITLIGKPVSLANCSRICLVGFGVWLNAFFNTSNCLALIVVRGPRRFEPFAPSSGLLFSACESPRQSGSPSIEPYFE